MEDPFYNPGTKEEFLHEKYVNSLFKWSVLYACIGMVLIVASVVLALVGYGRQAVISFFGGLTSYYIGYRTFRKAVTVEREYHE